MQYRLAAAARRLYRRVTYIPTKTPAAGAGQIIERFEGGVWVAYTLERFNGTTWDAVTLERYDGANWS